MAEARHTTTRRIAAIVLLLVALMLCVALFYYLTTQIRTSSKMSGELERAVATGPALEKGNPAESASTTSSEPAQSPEVTPAETATEQPAPQTIPILFTDDNGTPLAGFSFRFGVLDREQLSEAMFADQDEVDAPGERCPLQGESGQDGTFVIRQGRDFTGFECSLVRLFPQSPGLVFAGKGTTGNQMRAGEYEFTVPLHGKETTVQVLRTTRVSITVAFADGQLFEGRAGANIEALERGKDPPSQGFTVIAGQNASFDVPQKYKSVRIVVRAERPGYRVNNEWTFIAGELPAYQHLVIPADPDQFMLVLHLEQWGPKESVNIIVSDAGGNDWVTASVASGQTWRTLDAPLQWTCVVRVTGDSGVWRSEQFKATPGTTREFSPVAAVPFTVRARFKDPQGNVVTKAVINSLPCNYADWRSLANHAPSYDVGRSKRFLAPAGKLGIAEIGGLCPGEVELVFEAYQFEPATKVVSGRPNELIDLGDIVLQPATARIEVHLLNRNATVGYYVWLCAPKASGTIGLIKNVNQDRVAFEQLARRPYRLHISAGNGGRGMNVPVNFESGDTATIEVDVKDLQLPE